MNKGLAFLIALIMSFNLIGCSSNTQSENVTAGTIAGAVLGGGAGALIGQGTGKAVAIGVGIVGGALLGGYVGGQMDSTDNAKMNQAMNNPTFKSTSWTNSRTGSSYSAMPTSKVMAVKGYDYCRKFHTSATVDGKPEQINGTACRSNDGTWHSIS